ncbi:MAG: DNA translocase FtsK [Clostridia bacterium]|nr:DNA translocase FtsK [Clostridia bacterium]
MFKRGTDLKGGGFFGGLIGQTFLVCFRSAASFVIIIALLILGILLTLGITPKTVFDFVRNKVIDAKERRREEEELYAAEREKESVQPVVGSQLPLVEAPVKKRVKKGPKFDTDVSIDEDYPEEEPATVDTETPEEKRARLEKEKYNSVMENAMANKSKEELAAENAIFDGYEKVSPETRPDEDAIGADILDRLADSYLGGDKEGEDISVKREALSDGAEPKQVPIDIPKPEYKYPPIELLVEGANPSKAQNVREELHDNAAKLVNVLASFNVRTKIVGVSRGPTITRYELLPEPGTRVKSISNLVDDIALNLATSGVRIEAPIPGKAAVGIEVPNKTSETVYLRTLIGDKAFTEHKSKISSALGKDVAGSAVLMDIQKMPHLLIAGATGMGKSVCINSLLVSLLYKATPEEVKLILIDPKKVEFSIYNGLPHLLVPVVSDPRKAAGSLTWAVNEMERRFGLIESVGVREIDGYNKITENDPDYECLPRIVIVIDELADLMATAPDDVETSIARLAAKARAAGMHLVIGTQRPSVDVITGVIKANIPSRIAFTVASQVDSRTIIDRSGAENLIGRGDMLYNPVGASKPLRVQGAFVSDSEVDAVVSFIKANNCQNGAEYSDEVMKQIEAEAALCGVKKSGGGAGVAVDAGGADGGDPLIDQALEVAFESGKISTSLLQRRLSVGYGRAAKIIDKMEEMGYVSAPDGQKPRQLLITKQDYMEMKVKKEDVE